MFASVKSNEVYRNVSFVRIHLKNSLYSKLILYCKMLKWKCMEEERTFCAIMHSCKRVTVRAWHGVTLNTKWRLDRGVLKNHHEKWKKQQLLFYYDYGTYIFSKFFVYFCVYLARFSLCFLYYQDLKSIEKWWKDQ